MAITRRTVNDEDWKTAIAQHKPDIPAGSEVKILEKVNNLYGEFYKVEHNGIRYNLKERDLIL